MHKLAERNKFNKLELLEVLQEKTGDGHKKGLFKCDCGNTIKTAISRVKIGYTKSCGCLIGVGNKKHGMKGSPTYNSWSAAKNRCTCLTSKDYVRYGAAGVTFHQPWSDSFEEFLKDMGERPANMTLDRKDNSKGYSPDNCKWSTRSEQQCNKSISCTWDILGETFDSAEAAAIRFRVTAQTIHKWVSGWVDNRRNKIWGPKDGCTKICRY